MKKFISVTVYSAHHGLAAGAGVTAKSPGRLVVECPTGTITEQNVEEQEYIVLELETKNSNYQCFRPQGMPNRPRGKSFVWSTDSRFRTQYGHYPIPVHDHVE
jgi:hypothetical protein